MPTLTIDGRTVHAKDGATVLDTATDAGIYIPHLCAGAGMEPYGACRLCIVQVEGMRGLPAACTTTVAEGMTIQSDVEEVNRVRRVICEMLISDHPDECLTCSGHQECILHKVSSYLGVTTQRLRKLKRKTDIDDSNPFYRRDMSRCILCGLCTRACHEVRFVDAIEIAGRGYESRIAAPGDKPIRESDCVSCGECVDRCPTNALSAKSETMEPSAEVATTCVYCGCGCGLVLGTRGNRIVRVRGEKTHPISRGSLCVKGRFGLDFISSGERLTKPLVRKNGKLEETSWDDALSVVADKIGKIKKAHSPDAVAGLASAKCTNEENYLFQKFMRSVVGTNNVDHCARL